MRHPARLLAIGAAATSLVVLGVATADTGTTTPHVSQATSAVAVQPSPDTPNDPDSRDDTIIAWLRDNPAPDGHGTPDSYPRRNGSTSAILGDINDRTELVPQLEHCTQGTSISSGCLESTMVQLVVRHGPVPTSYALEDLIAAHPWVMADCHSASHGAGKAARFVTADVSLDALLPAMSGTCLTGFMHGALEAHAELEQDPKRLSEAFTICTLLVERRLDAMCADGIGHAAWNATADVNSAAAICADTDIGYFRSGCVAGILMQMYAPAHDGPARKPDRAVFELHRLCNNWPDHRHDGVQGFQSCAEGAPYLLIDAFQQTLEGLDSTTIRAELDVLVDALHGMCTRMRATGHCAKAIPRHTFAEWLSYDVNENEAICRRFTNHSGHCLRELASMITLVAGGIMEATSMDVDVLGGLEPPYVPDAVIDHFGWRHDVDTAGHLP